MATSKRKASGSDPTVITKPGTDEPSELPEGWNYRVVDGDLLVWHVTDNHVFRCSSVDDAFEHISENYTTV